MRFFRIWNLFRVVLYLFQGLVLEIWAFFAFWDRCESSSIWVTSLRLLPNTVLLFSFPLCNYHYYFVWLGSFNSSVSEFEYSGILIIGFIIVFPISRLFSFPGCDLNMGIPFWTVPVFHTCVSSTVLISHWSSHYVTVHSFSTNLNHFLLHRLIFLLFFVSILAIHALFLKIFVSTFSQVIFSIFYWKFYWRFCSTWYCDNCYLVHPWYHLVIGVERISILIIICFRIDSRCHYIPSRFY